MGLWEDLRNGKFTTYAKTAGMVSVVVLIIVGAFMITSILAAAFSFVFAGLMLILELPWLACCCAGPSVATFTRVFNHPLLRAFLYTVMSTVIWVVIFHANQSSIYVISALLLAGTALLYILAAFKKEHVEQAGNAAPGTPGMEKERPTNPAGAGYSNVV
eukprot:Unigene2627_Nuclearia_a/m.8122 Unigene2627_Nuclearia_a/g.8122  ORF Unigene2627_Nuclearia_a/g.8122 Unigene2627_Nuclearia_a/m.8122 type:complete len:160 (-) Unigene2627_Nuclearia_a:87-566(-)